jgi:dihydrofolate synthase/folylpolyglutamate synthase
MDYLGDTREKIGWEKAHIFRPGRPAIVADPAPPATVVEYARRIGADLQCIARDFGFEADRQQWLFWGRGGRRGGLAYPALRGASQLLNASAALAALDALRALLPVSAQAIREGLLQVELPGRFQVLPGRPTVILDVAHNPQAAAVLAENLGAMPSTGRTLAVVGMLRDKDLAGVVARLVGQVDQWFAATLDNPRGATALELADAVRAAGAAGEARLFDSPRAAFAAARETATANDRIIIFGSFYTVADVLEARGAKAQGPHGR